MTMDRKPHHNLEAESDLIACVLRHNPILDEVVQLVQSPDDFSAFKNQEIWRAALSLRANGMPISPVTLAECLRNVKRLDDVGSAYLSELIDRGGDLSEAKAYARIVRRHAVTRAVITAALEIVDEAESEAYPTSELIERAERIMFAVADRGHQSTVYTNAQVVDEALAILDRRITLFRKGEMIGAVPYGLVDLDKATAGMHAGELVVVAARPGIGKTIFGCHIADSASSRGLGAFFVSLEQARHELSLRLLSKHAKVNSFKLRDGTLSTFDRGLIGDAADKTRPSPLFWDDAPCQSVGKIAASARRLKAKNDIKLVVVDYMQLIDPANKKQKRHEAVGEMSRGLKLLARELGIPVVAMAQLNRDSETQSREPKLSDLRESGGIEQDADTVILMHQTVNDKESPTAQIQLLIRKQRNGPLKDIWVTHEKKHYAITNTGDDSQAEDCPRPPDVPPTF